MRLAQDGGAGFTRAHPGIDVRLDATLDNRRLAAEGFDVAIRCAKVHPAGGVAPFSESMRPMCSPRLLSELDVPLRHRPAVLRTLEQWPPDEAMRSRTADTLADSPPKTPPGRAAPPAASTR